MPKRFLISRLSSLGDVVCCLPAAGALKSVFPDSEIVWVVDPRFAGVVRCCRFVDSVVEAKPGFHPSTWPKLEGEFDAALDLQGLLKSALPVARAKAKEKLGYHWQREGAWLFSRRVLPDPNSYHIVDQYVDTARAAGGVSHFAEFGLSPTTEALSKVRAILKEKSISERFVVMNPGAGWATKRWPAEHFAAVADRLKANGVDTVLIGSKAESDMGAAQQVERAAESAPAMFVGKTNIEELIALLSFADAHLGGDTGSTHITAALGKPAVGLYSITRPKRSCPYGQVERCHYDPDGLDRISPDAVSKSLLEAIG